MNADENRNASGVNRDFYDRFAETGQPYWKHMAAPRMRLARFRELAAGISPNSICDFGCGNGQLLKAMGRDHKSARLAGIDLSQAQIAVNKRNHPEIDWLAADLSRQLEPGSIKEPPELGLSSEVIEHLERPDVYLKNIFETLAPGGTLLLSTQSGKVRFTERHVGHVRHYPAAEMAGMLKNAGFSEVRAWNEGFPFHDLSKIIANLNPEKTIAAFDVKDYGPAQLFISAALRLLFRFNLKTYGAQLFATARKPLETHEK